MSQSNKAQLPTLLPLPKVPGIFGFSRSYTYREAAKNNLELVKIGNRTMLVTESAVAHIAALPRMTPSRNT